MFASRNLISKIPKAGLSAAFESCSSRTLSKFSACTSRTLTGFQQTTFSSLAKHKPSLVSRNYVNSLSTKSNPSNFFSRRWDQYSGGQTLTRAAPRTWSTPTLTPQQKLTATVLIAGGVMGLGSLYLYEQSTPEDVLRKQADRLSPVQRSMFSSTCMRVVASLGVTAASSYAFFHSGIIFRVSPLVLGIGSLIGSIGLMYGTMSVPKENALLKNSLWLGFNGLMGLSLAPFGILGGPLVMRAAVTTGCVVGGLSFVAANAPSESFLWMTGPLSIGLGVLIGAGLGRMFFPASTLLQNVSIYGGMAVFGGLLLVDIQRVMHRIRFTPPSSYDPINSSIGIYLDIVNLFTRILEYMALSKNNRR